MPYWEALNLLVQFCREHSGLTDMSWHLSTSVLVARSTSRLAKWWWHHHFLPWLLTTKWNISRRKHWIMQPTSTSTSFLMWITPSLHGTMDHKSLKDSWTTWIVSTRTSNSLWRNLPFLNINIQRRLDCVMGHKVYWKSIHTNLYLNYGTHNHIFNKKVIISTLVQEIRALWS